MGQALFIIQYKTNNIILNGIQNNVAITIIDKIE